MADLFGVDLAAARQLSGDLSSIRTSLASLKADVHDRGQSSGSSKIEAALDRFFRDSSDSRGKLDKLLENAIGMLNGLVDGETAVDTDLSRAFDPVPAP